MFCSRRRESPALAIDLRTPPPPPPAPPRRSASACRLPRGTLLLAARREEAGRLPPNYSQIFARNNSALRRAPRLVWKKLPRNRLQAESPELRQFAEQVARHFRLRQ
jgi:hypothetical protein